MPHVLKLSLLPYSAPLCGAKTKGEKSLKYGSHMELQYIPLLRV